MYNIYEISAEEIAEILEIAMERNSAMLDAVASRIALEIKDRVAHNLLAARRRVRDEDPSKVVYSKEEIICPNCGAESEDSTVVRGAGFRHCHKCHMKYSIEEGQ